MDINEFEKRLNEFTVERDKVLAALLNTNAMNQAMLEAVLDNQSMILSLLDPEKDSNAYREDARERAKHYLAEIQATLSSKM